MEYQVIKEYEAQEQFDEYINERTPDIQILGMTYTPSEILKQADPIAYRTIFDEFAEHLYGGSIVIEDYNDDNVITCPECDVVTDDYRGDWCKDCDKQGGYDA